MSVSWCSLHQKETCEKEMQVRGSSSQARRQEYRLRSRLAHSFAKNRRETFWSDIKRLNNSRTPQSSPVVDGLCGSSNIANGFASKFSTLLNKHSSTSQSSLLSSIQSSLTVSDLSSVVLSEDHIAEAISQLKSHKSDAYGVTSEHIKFAALALANRYFTLHCNSSLWLYATMLPRFSPCPYP
jgi:hypothetical protein